MALLLLALNGMIEKLKHFLKSYWIFVLLSLLVVFVINLAVSKPKITLPKIDQSQLLKHPSLVSAPLEKGEIEFVSAINDKPQAPEKLPVYLARPKASYDYSILIRQKQNETPISSVGEAENLARAFLLKNNRLTDELSNSDYKVNFMKTGGFETFQVNNFEDADILSIEFYPKVNNYLIVGNTPFSSLMEVLLNKKGIIKKVSDATANYDQSEARTLPIVSFEKAWQMLTEQKGIITALSVQETTYNPQPARVQQVIVNTASLAYFQEQNLPASLQPIWVFTGDTVIDGATYSKVAIYLPAIEEDYFVKE